MVNIGSKGLSLSLGGNLVDAVATVVVNSESYVDQNPVGTNAFIQVAFGSAQSNQFASVNGAGLITLLEAGYYDVRLRLSFGRQTNNGNALLIARAVVNGAQSGPSQAIHMSGVQFNIPIEFTFSLDAEADTTISFQIMRDSSGANDGGLYAFTPTNLSWNPSPSADILITRWVGLS